MIQINNLQDTICNCLQVSAHRKTNLLNFSLRLMAVVGLFSGAILSSTSEALAGGSVTLDHTEFNFGQFPVRGSASHTFWITAIGPDTVVIDTILPGCGCTNIPLKTRILAPGDSVAFEVVFDSKGILGSVAKRPGFRIKGDSARYDVKFYASVISGEEDFYPLAISPPLFPLLEKLAREGKEFPFTLTNKADEDISVELVDFPHDIFEVTVPNSIPAGGTIKGHFTLRSDYPKSTPIKKSMTFEVNKSQLFRLTAPITMSSPVVIGSETSSKK